MSIKNDREWEIIQVGGTERGRYLLFRIRFERITRYMIYIENPEGECALECIDVSESLARNYFARIVKGELAPCHREPFRRMAWRSPSNLRILP